MRIADVCEFYAPRGGGVKTYVHTRWTAAARSGQQVFVIAPAAEDRITEVDGGALVEVKAPRHPADPKYHIFWDTPPVHDALRRIAPDLIEISSPWRGLTLGMRYPEPVPRTMFMHEEPIEKWAYGLFDRLLSRSTIDRTVAGWLWQRMRKRYAKADAVICASDAVTHFLRGQGIERLHTVPMGVERSSFSPEHRNEQMRRDLLGRMDLPETATLIVGVGRHNREKRWPAVISAVERLGQEYPAGLVMLGTGPETPKLERLVRGNPHILMLEPVHERRKYASLLASADMMVSAGIETFGLAAAEGIASGLPLVAEAGGAVSTFCKPAFSEFYDRVDPEHISAALTRLVKSLPDARTAAASEAAHVRRLDEHFEEIFSLYQALAERGHARTQVPFP
ncbi:MULTISPECIES: glycosyltransferase [Pacificimonas]|nr:MULTISPECIES: glycosyltransferase [Pacificimonas]MBZ6378374.1 glycosyltransferase [Pacificimonas aurantium]